MPLVSRLIIGSDRDRSARRVNRTRLQLDELGWCDAAGAAQDLYGQTADVARDTAVTFEKWLRSSIETKPYAAVAVALGIGWLIGRMHRPL